MSEAAIWAVVPAAGAGTRMGSQTPKQYLPLAGRCVVEHTLERLLGHPRIRAVMVAISSGDERWDQVSARFGENLYTTVGGAERVNSVFAGLMALNQRAADNDWVMVHDAARPCLRGDDIDRMLRELADDECGGILAVPVRDTLKRSNQARAITGTVDRTALWHALTPQMFRFAALKAALKKAIDGDVQVTDEAQAIELAGGVPKLVEGHADNLKITHPADLPLAELFLKAQLDEIK